MINPKIAKYLVFFISAGSLVNVNIFGLISVSEVICILILPYLIFQRRNVLKSFSQNEKITGFMILIWTIAISLSDIINQTPFLKFLKGIGHPLAILASFYTLNTLLQSTKYFFKYFIYGSVVSAVLFYFTDKIAQEQFRFGVYNIIIAFIFVITYKLWGQGQKKVVYFILFLVSVLAFWNGGRISGLILIFAILILYYASVNKSVSNFNLSQQRLIYIVTGVFLVIVLIQEVYVYAVKNKMFSGDFQIKYEQQLSTGLPLILSGRTEILGSSQAIIDAPFFGHGSWASNPKYLNIILNKTGVSNKEQFDYNMDSFGQSKIPSHSFLFGEWVEHGVLGVFFMLFFCSRLISLLVFFIRNINFSYSPYLCFIFLTYFWHLFFSPLASDKRILFSVILAVYSYSTHIENIKQIYANDKNK
jgi:hypothetical protein